MLKPEGPLRLKVPGNLCQFIGLVTFDEGEVVHAFL